MRRSALWGPLTIQARIALLVVACIVPGWLATAFISYSSYKSERANIEQNTLATARTVMHGVERDIAANLAAVQALAQARTIDRGDFASFYDQAQEVLRYTSGFTIVLTDASGQQVVNLLRPFGSPLPRHGSPAQLQRVLDTRKPVVSDLFIGSVTGKPIVVIEVPVTRKGKVLYSLALGIDPSQLGALLQQQGLPSQWVVSIFDSSGTIVARDRGAKQFVGKKGVPALMRRMLEVTEGAVDTVTLEGIPVMSVFSRSPAYGWVVAIGVPEAILTADLRRRFEQFAVAAVLLLLAGLALAAVIGRRIARPIEALIAPALAIGRGEPASIPPLSVKEAEAVRKALLEAQQLIREREQERDRAEQANSAKAAFLANVSHALRTPLNAILGFSRLMRNSPNATREQVRHLDIIGRSGEHLLQLINNVLDLSKIESGHIELEETEFDLHNTLEEIRSLLHVRAVEKGVQFAPVQRPDLPRYVRADAGKLRQVLFNLLGNAIKFTQSGAVALRTRVVRRESPELAWVRFEVEDSGPGISAEDRERLFSPFVQLSEQPKTETGTGLGLVISKQYVELMGGRLGVTSEPGKGSVFHFEIPLRMPHATEEVAAKTLQRHIIGLAPGQPSYRLLIVEDQPDNRLLLRSLLDPLGFELREAVDALEAVTQFEQWRPHLIWMDMRIPGPDGMEATRRIKASPAGAQTIIVAVTAHALEGERRQILATGCDGFIRKPYRDTEIFGALEKYLGVRFVYADEQPSADSTDTGTLRIEQLQQLPPPLLQELRDAAELLDGQRCLELVERIGKIDHAPSARIKRMVDNLQYTELLRVLDESLGARSA